MAVSRKKLADNLQRVGDNIAAAAERAGRNPADVLLVAVTKAADIDDLKTLIDLGVADLGENRVQQLVGRAEAVAAWLARRRKEAPPPPRWHMIGHLQRNKVKALLNHARILHSLDSTRLAQEIEKQAGKLDLTLDAFLEFNVAGELAKSGAPLEQAGPLAEAAARCRHIRVHGLMTMPPFDPDPEAARPYFAQLRELLEKLQRDGAVGPECVHLSMGMTIDYAVAVEEGATFVRIGSALFEGVAVH